MQRRWCAWCGDDLEKDDAHFCGRKCELDFWRDVHLSDEDPSVVWASLRAPLEKPVSSTIHLRPR